MLRENVLISMLKTDPNQRRPKEDHEPAVELDRVSK